MAPKGTFDVFAMPNDTHGDGSPNEHALFLRPFISLSELIGEATEKVCFSVSIYQVISQREYTIVPWDPCAAIRHNPRDGSQVPGMGGTIATQTSVAQVFGSRISRCIRTHSAANTD